MTTHPETPRPRGLVLVFALVFAVAMVLAFQLGQRTGLRLFSVFTALAAWTLVVTLGNLLPPLRWGLRPALRVLGTLTVIALPVWVYHFKPFAFTG
ncbi:MAG TPA: hypothetical protein VGE76_00030, partial [Opitutaceae bacterium]